MRRTINRRQVLKAATWGGVFTIIQRELGGPMSGSTWPESAWAVKAQAKSVT